MRRFALVILGAAALSCATGQDYAALVDPFWGSGATDTPLSEGMARGWNWEKAQSGNCSPAAVLPFGWVSACAFTGGYSSGYGRTGYSSCETAPLMGGQNMAWGISHLHQSGVGLMHKFYNYLLLTPFCEGADISKASVLADETASPGYYSASLPDYGVSFELTARDFAALHRYSFGEGEGFLRVDAAHLGLGTECFKVIRPYEKPEQAEACSLKAQEGNCWTGTVRTYGMDVHFALAFGRTPEVVEATDSTMTVKFGNGKAELAAGFSLLSEEDALDHAQKALVTGFDKSRKAAHKCWDKALGRVRASFPDPSQERLFYSTLYQSMIKPCKCAEGRFIDFTTFWDIYHTQLPLALSLFPSTGKGITEHILHTADSIGFSPIYQILEDGHKDKDNQATALPVYTLCDACHRGLSDYPELKKALLKEYAHIDLEGTPPSHTLDVAGAYKAGEFVAKAFSDSAFADSLQALSGIWKNVYDPSTGLLFESGVYYEGNHWNYSFRPHTGMNERVEMAGGAGQFCSLLDKFFRVGDDCPEWEAEKDRTRRRDYFEGLNNESDMDSPYSYIWCGRTDRLAEVIDVVRRCRFCCGQGGCPGNNDAGATSSWYVWNCLGLYPLAGTPFYLLGTPSVKSAQIDFAGGTLSIEVERESGCSIYPVAYSFNGTVSREPWIPVSELEKGGTLVFHLSDKPAEGLSPIPNWL